MEKKILIVDDTPDWVSMLTLRLKHEGYQVAVAFDSMQALSQAKEFWPDLILLDIMMPMGGGIEALRRLKQSTKTFPIPVIVITAKEDQETKTTAEGLGISGYFTKPVQMDELISQIKEVLTP